MSGEKSLFIRALRTYQGSGTAVFSFFIPGDLITDIADISRIERHEDDVLEGFQRKAIQKHIGNIVEYLEQDDVLFPNSIILAFSPQIEFRQARGRDPKGTIDSGSIGTLEIPLRTEGNRVAWIVDGQQRSLALAKAKNKPLNVPVVAFVADDLEMQREQFILVNKAKPLSARLINELLPEVDTHLPRDLAVRKIPSELCGLLNRDPESPFYNKIKRMTHDGQSEAVILDTSIIEMIKNSIRNPLGALAHYKSLGTEPSDIDGMYRTLLMYWTAVKEEFPDAWGLPPTKSRLMHSAGIHCMGVLMDRIMNRTSHAKNQDKEIRLALSRVSPHCHWTEGTWDQIDLEWNEIQKVGRHLKLLSELLAQIDYRSQIEK